MIQPLNVRLAERLGIRTALVAQFLWDMLEARHSARTVDFDGRRWLRMGAGALSVHLPCLTPYAARSELNRLAALGIVRMRVLNDDRFDHTRWYSFTGFGVGLMASMEAPGRPLGDAQPGLRSASKKTI